MRTFRAPFTTLLLPILFGACGDGGADASADAIDNSPVVTSEVPELSTGELLGMDRASLTAFTPWRAGTVTSTAADAAPTARQTGVEALTADGFDRLVLSFRQGAPAPGYRIGVAGSDPQTLCGEETTFEESGVLIHLSPASVRDAAGDWTVDSREVDLGLPVASGARLVCEGDRQVVWFVATAPDAVEVRVLNLLTPTRIAVDIRPGDTGPE
jgi:hypothetical protein